MTATMIETDTTHLFNPLTTEHPDHASHIVLIPPSEKMSAQAYVLAARINGTQVEALCGYRWIPWRDPLSLPVCEKCLSEWNERGHEGVPES